MRKKEYLFLILKNILIVKKKNKTTNKLIAAFSAELNHNIFIGKKLVRTAEHNPNFSSSNQINKTKKVKKGIMKLLKKELKNIGIKLFKPKTEKRIAIINDHPKGLGFILQAFIKSKY
ncbi:MAG: hypothetical protein ABIC91_00395 [Nanoarchaeota archaeon]